MRVWVALSGMRGVGSVSVMVGLLSAGVPAGVFADEDVPRLLDRMVITGTAQDAMEQPGSGQVLEQADLDRFSHGDAHRILREIPGVNVHEEEGFGLFPHIGLRGTRLERSSRITVMEDGVLIAPAPYAAPAAYYFPQMGRMDSVEVRKGSSAIRSGPYTTGGAVNLRSTPIPRADTAGHAQLLFGGDDGHRHRAWVGGNDGQWGWLLEGWDSGSEGFKRLDRVTDDGESRPNSPVPDTGFDARNFLGKLRWAPDVAGVYQHWELKLAVDDRSANETYLGLTLDDFEANPFRRYRGSQLDQINTEHEQYQLTHYVEPARNLDVTTTAYRNNFARNWYKLHGVQDDPAGSFIGISEILASPGDNTSAMDWIRGEGGNDVLGKVRANNREYYSQGLQSTLGYFFNTTQMAHELEIGVRYHEDEEDRWQWEDSYRMDNGSMVLVRPGDEQGAEGNATSGIPGSTTNRVTRARATAIHVQNTMRGGNWTLTPGLRFEDITITRRDYQDGANPDRNVLTGSRSADYQVWLPGVGATWRQGPDLVLLGGVHKGFAPAGADPDVDEEESWNYELGLRWRRQGLHSELIGFYNRYDNLVGECTASTGGGCVVGDQFNGGRVEVRGLEASTGYDLARLIGVGYGVPVRAAWTWTETGFRSAFNSDFEEWGEVERGDELPQIPQQQFNLGIGVDHHLWGLNLNANYVGETRAVAGSGSIPADERIESRWLLDISGEYRVHANARLFASVENLTDETYLAAIRPAGARPGAPRTGWVGLKLDF